jgi:flagellar protein FlaG
MSVELTAAAIDILPVKPQKNQRSDQQFLSEFTDSNQGAENKVSGVKKVEDIQDLHQASKKSTEEKEVMTVPQLEKVAKQLQEFIGTMNRGLEFIVDEDSGRDVIKVIDKNSGDVIKQYPSEEVLSLVSKLSEATGNFVDSKI